MGNDLPLNRYRVFQAIRPAQISSADVFRDIQLILPNFVWTFVRPITPFSAVQNYEH
jgi:hypothetical protein